MSDELREAAETIVGAFGNRSTSELTPYGRAALLLAETYLIMVAAGDDEPITREWWLEEFQGTCFLIDDKFLLLIMKDDGGQIMIQTHVHGDTQSGKRLLPGRTRGELRSLLDLLGVPLARISDA